MTRLEEGSFDTRYDHIVEALTAKGQSFEVGEEVIAGVTYPVFKNMPKNLPEVYQMASLHGKKSFLVTEDETISFADCLKQASYLADTLVSEFEVQKGDRIGLAMRNSPAWCIAFMAITQVGAVAVALNSWWQGEELEFALEDTEPVLVFADPKRLSLIEGYVKRTQTTSVLVTDTKKCPPDVYLFSELLKNYEEDQPVSRDIYPDDTAAIFYTSGSTSIPKGAVVSHKMIITTLFQWALMGTAADVAEGKVESGDDSQEAVLVCLPLFHVTACYNQFLLSIVSGRKLVFLEKWDVNKAMGAIEAHKITHFIGVPTMTHELLHAPDRASYNLSSLKEFGGGGAARPASQVQALNDTFNIPVGIGYGMTETNALGCINSRESYLQKPASVGRPSAPMVQLRIVGSDGSEIPTGQIGDIQIKSPSNITKYWNDERAGSLAVFDGWLDTGDIGYLDNENYLFIVDRKKSIVIRGGENISTLEVEEVIYEHPLVREVAVFGVPDARLGEVLATSITVATGGELSDETLRLFLADKLAHFKIPEYISISQAVLPKGGTGKIDKNLIRKSFLASKPETIEA